MKKTLTVLVALGLILSGSRFIGVAASAPANAYYELPDVYVPTPK